MKPPAGVRVRLGKGVYFYDFICNRKPPTGVRISLRDLLIVIVIMFIPAFIRDELLFYCGLFILYLFKILSRI